MSAAGIVREREVRAHSTRGKRGQNESGDDPDGDESAPPAVGPTDRAVDGHDREGAERDQADPDEPPWDFVEHPLPIGRDRHERPGVPGDRSDDRDHDEDEERAKDDHAFLEVAARSRSPDFVGQDRERGRSGANDGQHATQADV